MPTIEDQLALEQEMQDRGSATYTKNQRKAEETGRGAELDYSRRLMQEYLQPMIEALEKLQAQRGPGKFGVARKLLERVDAPKAMFIALKGLFNAFTIEEPVASTAARIGRMVEDEIRFTRFQDLYTDYYDTIIKDFKRKGTKDYRYMHRVLTHSANNQEDGWIVWSQRERIDVGMRLLDIILTESDLVDKHTGYKGNKTEVLLVPTDAAKQWIDKHEAHMSVMFAERGPCIIEPDMWTSISQGGYYSPVMRKNTPMVKTSGKMQQKLLEKNDLTEVQEAINSQMRVPWSVNLRVLDVLKTVWAQDLGVGIPHSEKLTPPDCPVPTKEELKISGKVLTEKEIALLNEWKKVASEVYTMEKERIAQAFQTTRIIKMANQYGSYSSFWYVWYADFRGRLYTATAGFSPQGPDAAKGLLRFAQGKPLGEDGLYWLKVHIANRYGFDKEDFPVRVAWTEERHEILLAIAADPIGNIHHWKDADKPYQFLAAVFEYAEATALTDLGYSDRDYVSRLPIGLDGSCNGLQNFSAMLRDEIGGRATNLVPADKPADIYSEVAKVATLKVDALSLEKAVLRKLEDLSKCSGEADEWLNYAKEHGSGFLPRSLAKRPVMTLPYGATRQSCTQYIFQDIIKNKWTKKFTNGPWSAAAWLCPIVWAAIGEVVVAAREAMSWLQKLANGMSKINKPIVWKTKDGFIAIQNSREIETVKINTQLAGRFQVKVGAFTDRIDANKQRTGISPNFVHSQDATHMRSTIRLAQSEGIHNIACIHDDYGTYACDTTRFHKIIREAFVAMYRDFDPLDQLYRIALAYGATVPVVPAKGALDIELVLESKHFFG